jgi:hypothetical protein
MSERSQPTPPALPEDLLRRLTPAQRQVLEESRTRAANFHQVVISKGIGPERSEPEADEPTRPQSQERSVV